MLWFTGLHGLVTGFTDKFQYAEFICLQANVVQYQLFRLQGAAIYMLTWSISGCLICRVQLFMVNTRSVNLHIFLIRSRTKRFSHSPRPNFNNVLKDYIIQKTSINKERPVITQAMPNL